MSKGLLSANIVKSVLCNTEKLTIKSDYITQAECRANYNNVMDV